MASNDKDTSRSSNNILKGLMNLRNITRATNKQTYGVSKDIPSMVADNVNKEVLEISKLMSDKDKSVINSYMTRARMQNQDTNKKITDLYQIINDEKMLNSMKTLIGDHNFQLAQTLKDYEIIKRCIPQIHKVITNLKNSIISPDAMAASAIGLELPSDMSDSEKSTINKIIEKYGLNERLDDIVMEYLISSVKYITVVPYSMIPEMLKSNNINESIQSIENAFENMSTSLLEASGSITESLNEAVEIEYYDNDNAIASNRISKFTIDDSNYKTMLNETLNNIEFINGGMNYFKSAIMNEVIAEARLKNDDLDNSMKNIVKILQNRTKSNVKNSAENINDMLTTDGFLPRSKVRDIEKKVDFKGCHIEELDPSRVIPFKLRGTLIGYFYVEEKKNPLDTSNMTNITSIMDRINASVYMKQTQTNNGSMVEAMVIKSVSERLMKAIDSNFINDNYEDLNIIYEFVKINNIHKKKCKVTFFHPNDICEFKRKDGSIMKNCMFIAKLYLLTLLTNVLANVTRGSDRQIHYVKTGLTTDVEGTVNSTIRAIKQNQVRYSDIGTINDIFNIVGSMVDVFMPISIDGERPIETETISGQNIDMNDEFLASLLRAIIQSFGLPSSIIDDFENIEFARTIPMANLEMAKMVLNSQNEINEPLTKLIRLIVCYELPDLYNVNEIYAKLSPPSAIYIEMNKERLQSVMDISETLAPIMLPQDDMETMAQMRVRKFRELYLKKNLPTLDWNAIDEMVKESLTMAQEEMKLTKQLNSDNEKDNPDNGYDY